MPERDRSWEPDVSFRRRRLQRSATPDPISAATYGTRGVPARVPIDADHIADLATSWAIFLEEHDSLDEPLIFWTPAIPGWPRAISPAREPAGTSPTGLSPKRLIDREPHVYGVACTAFRVGQELSASGTRIVRRSGARAAIHRHAAQPATTPCLEHGAERGGQVEPGRTTCAERAWPD